MSTILNYKNSELAGKKRVYQENKTVQFHNPIYQQSGRYGCKYCKRDHVKGNNRVYKTLWNLYFHQKRIHPHEDNIKESIENLADLVIQGVLL